MSGFCSGWGKHNCAKPCGTCTPGLLEASDSVSHSTEEKAICGDSQGWCPYFKDYSGFCSGWGKNNCAKTCGTCQGGWPGLLEASDSVERSTDGEGWCRDSKGFCPYIKHMSGFCSGWGKYNCAKSCGTCTPGLLEASDSVSHDELMNSQAALLEASDSVERSTDGEGWCRDSKGFCPYIKHMSG